MDKRRAPQAASFFSAPHAPRPYGVVVKFCARLAAVVFFAIAQTIPTFAAVYNLKVITDASPDYSDMDSMVHSITSNWETPEQKCWAMFYWNHITRRQTSPMELHGLAVTDPVRQFNDYGYTMCSTISGINCAIWDAMGLKTKYWDISNHTVSEVEYGGAWHMYDNSMTAIYTLCDGKTIAPVDQIGRALACEASRGQSEPGHIAKYHCLTSTGPRGFLTGADTIRSVDEEFRCFNPNGLKYRSYFYDWDRGHRYILNIRENESYTRNYHSLGKEPEFYVPNNGKDPEAANTRYRIRGNGVWKWRPNLAEARHENSMTFKIDGANVITALKMRGQLREPATISVSSVNGLKWTNVANATTNFDMKFVDQVNGAYELLVRFTPASITDLEFETITMLNSKTQPGLNIGKNTIHVGASEQTESIVLWPDLRDPQYQSTVIDSRAGFSAGHPGYLPVITGGPQHYVTFKIDAPRDITSIHYGGRFYNRAPGSHVDLQHSFDEGRTWTTTYSLTNTAEPWDVIHYESLTNVPPAVRTVFFKYLIHSPEKGASGCGLYGVRMEARHKPANTNFSPLQVTFDWSERQEDYSLIERSHTETISKLPHRYTINVGGSDHPIVRSLKIASTASITLPFRSGEGRSEGPTSSEKFIPRWATYGKNLALQKPYTVSIQSNTNWGAGDPDGKKLTDGIVGPPYPGGLAPTFALGWDKGKNADITVDLGSSQSCAAFRIQVGAGYPWWDALKGQFKDKVELFTSTDGQNFIPRGNFNFNLRWKDLPVNHFWPDEEIIAAHNFELSLPDPIQARYVRFSVKPERSLTVSEVEVLDAIKYHPFDLRVALPLQ